MFTVIEVGFSEPDPRVVATVFDVAAGRGHWFVKEQMHRLRVAQPYFYKYITDLKATDNPSSALDQGVATMTAILNPGDSDYLKPPVILPYILSLVKRDRTRVFGADRPEQWEKGYLGVPSPAFNYCMELFNETPTLANRARATMGSLKDAGRKRDFYQGLFLGLAPFVYADKLEPRIFMGLHPCFDLPERLLSLVTTAKARNYQFPTRFN